MVRSPRPPLSPLARKLLEQFEQALEKADELPRRLREPRMSNLLRVLAAAQRDAGSPLPRRRAPVPAREPLGKRPSAAQLARAAVFRREPDGRFSFEIGTRSLAPVRDPRDGMAAIMAYEFEHDTHVDIYVLFADGTVWELDDDANTIRKWG
jgi:hypothetical protein